MNKSCHDCKFMQSDDQYRGFGSCRRYPPQIIVGTQRGHSFYFPEVTADDWCGEFVDRHTYHPGSHS